MGHNFLNTQNNNNGKDLTSPEILAIVHEFLVICATKKPDFDYKECLPKDISAVSFFLQVSTDFSIFVVFSVYAVVSSVSCFGAPEHVGKLSYSYPHIFQWHKLSWTE